MGGVLVPGDKPTLHKSVFFYDEVVQAITLEAQRQPPT